MANNQRITVEKHAELSDFNITQNTTSGKNKRETKTYSWKNELSLFYLNPVKDLLSLSGEKNDISGVLQIFSKNVPDLEQELVAAASSNKLNPEQLSNQRLGFFFYSIFRKRINKKFREKK